ncbi:MAG: DUF4292 domain-containing protein [Bacteroidota bacterium]
MSDFSQRATVLGVGMLLVASCGPSSSVLVNDLRDLPADVLAARLHARDGRITSMTGKGSVLFEGPEASGSAYFSMALKKPDSLLIMLEGPFGIDAGFLFLSRAKYVMYNSMENRAVTGVPTPETIRGTIPVELTAEQILTMFRGGFTLPDTSPSAYVLEDGAVRAEYIVRGERQTFWVDPQDNLVVRYEARDRSEALQIEATASRVTQQDGVAAPRRVTVRFPSRGQRVSISYSSLELNPAHASLEYTLPANARITIR